MSKISWGGRLYTKKDFLNAVHEEFAEAIYWRMCGDTVIPPGKIKKTDLAGWMELAGAYFISPK